MTSQADATQTTSAGLLAAVRAGVRRALLAAGLFSLGVNLLMLTVPLYMLQIFDRVLMSRSLDTLAMLTAIALAGLVTLGLLEVVRGFVFLRLGGWLERKLSGYVLAGSLDAALRDGPTSAQGLRDLQTVRGFLAGPGMVPLLDAPWIPLFLAVIFLLHPLLGWLALGGVLFLLVAAVANQLATRCGLRQAGEAAISATQEAEAAARNADVIAAMGLLPAILRRWHEENGAALAAGDRVARRNVGISGFAKFSRLLLQLAVFGLGAMLVLQGELTAGGMIAASILMGRALAPIDMAIGAWRTALGALSAYRRVTGSLARARFDRDGLTLPAPEGRLAVEGVSFAYPGQSEAILRNVSFLLEPGESLALLGPAAAGKTTLARLIVGNLAPWAGHLRLDGAEMSDWSPLDRGRYVGYVPQDVELFGGTVRQNIARMSDAEEGVIEAARRVGAHEMILALSNGYETPIGERGAVLSGGQRQLVALARAVYGSPRLVVLDEPNSNLDQEGEAALVETLRHLKATGATVVVTTHRPSVLQQVDKILLLRQGQVQVFGPSAEILPKLIAPARAARPPGAVAARAGLSGGVL